MSVTNDQRETRLNRLLCHDGFSFVDERPQTEHHSALPPRLLDEEGEVFCDLSDSVVAALDAASDAAALAVLQHIHSVILIVRERSFKAGIRAGRAQITSTLHELIGIHKLQESLERMESSLHEAINRR